MGVYGSAWIEVVLTVTITGSSPRVSISFAVFVPVRPSIFISFQVTSSVSHTGGGDSGFQAVWCGSAAAKLTTGSSVSFRLCNGYI